MNVTGEQVKGAMTAAGIESVDHHQCSICGYMTRYVREGGALFFDAGCYCTGGARLEPRSWESAAEWVNMQRPDWHEKLSAAFGLSAAVV